MKLTCGIFDFDGTLFDSMYIWETVGANYLRSLEKEPSPTLREEVRAMSLLQSARYFKEQYHLPQSIEEITAGINRIVEHFYLSEIQPKPGILPFLQQIKEAGLSLCIATATDRPLIEAALCRCGMRPYFDAIFTCGEVGHGKDEPIIFRRAMESFHADRTTTVVFEDAFHAAKTAKDDGFFVAAVFDSSEKQQEALRLSSDCFLENYEDLSPFWQFVSSLSD